MVGRGSLSGWEKGPDHPLEVEAEDPLVEAKKIQRISHHLSIRSKLKVEAEKYKK